MKAQVILSCGCACRPLGVIAIVRHLQHDHNSSITLSITACIYPPHGNKAVHHCHVQVTGEIIIGEFASANDPDEYEWSVTAEGTGTAQDKLKDHVSTLRKPVFDKLQRYVTALNSLI